jgi:centrosomal protein CEP135
LQVENRDREIERLHRVLDGGRSADTLSLESRLKSNEKIIANQNAQVNKISFHLKRFHFVKI